MVLVYETRHAPIPGWGCTHKAWEKIKRLDTDGPSRWHWIKVWINSISKSEYGPTWTWNKLSSTKAKHWNPHVSLNISVLIVAGFQSSKALAWQPPSTAPAPRSNSQCFPWCFPSPQRRRPRDWSRPPGTGHLSWVYLMPPIGLSTMLTQVYI